MKHILSILLCCMPMAMMAQTLNIVCGEVTYKIPAVQAGEMTYSDGTSVTVMGKTLSIADITRMYVDNSEVTDNSVTVSYSGTTAAVTVAGNCMSKLTVSATGADVDITQSEDLADEITYTLSGTSDDGQFKMDGELKATVVLNGLTLTNADGCPIDIENGKRIALTITGANTLADGSASTKKGCLYVKGHTEVSGTGTLSLTASGTKANGMYSGEYLQLTKNFTGTITVNSSTKDGIHCSQYFQMNNGNIIVTAPGEDGIQVEASGDADYDEDVADGSCLIKGGNIDVTVTAAGVKAIRCDSTMTINESKNTTTIKVTGTSTAYAAKGLKAQTMNIAAGTFTISMAGKGMWDTDDNEASSCACLKAHDMVIDGGDFTLTATGSGGKGLSCDSTLIVNGGTMTAATSGGCYYATSATSENTNYTGSLDKINTKYKSSAKGFKVGTTTTVGNTEVKTGAMTVNGGTITITTKTNGAEGIECKGTMDITGGTIDVTSYDDAINSGKTMTITGGNVTVNASNNDGLDSNGDLWIKGGVIAAYGTTAPECGIDANEEQNYHVYITGGTLLAIGGSNSYPANSSSTQAYVSTTGTVTKGNTITLKSGSTELASFTLARTYSSSGGGMGGGNRPGGGGGGMSGGSTSILISCPGLTSGSSYTVVNGTTSTSVTATKYSSSSGGGGFRF